MHFYSVKVNYYEDETTWNPYSLSRISLQTLTGKLESFADCLWTGKKAGRATLVECLSVRHTASPISRMGRASPWTLNSWSVHDNLQGLLTHWEWLCGGVQMKRELAGISAWWALPKIPPLCLLSTAKPAWVSFTSEYSCFNLLCLILQFSPQRTVFPALRILLSSLQTQPRKGLAAHLSWMPP